MSEHKLLEVKNLRKYFTKPYGFFGQKTQITHAVENISFHINRQETFGLVGESGCGKSTAGRTIIRLYKPTAGEILYEGKDLAKLDRQNLLPYRKKIQMIFQDPYTSLNARMTVLDLLMEPVDLHSEHEDEAQKKKIVFDLLDRVGLLKEHANRYPHEFSGGQRQRIGIARALAVQPEFVICDEPISALDVSIQAQIVNMLEDLQRDLGLTYLFIAHDLSMVRHISDRIGVMYLGHIVEMGKSEEIYQHFMHPYTEALLSSVPIPDPHKARSRQSIILQGDVPSPIHPPSGCPFRTRCPYVMDICVHENPKLIDYGGEHLVACHKVEQTSRPEPKVSSEVSNNKDQSSINQKS